MKPLIAITGPTACGKTSLGLSLAKALKGEILNADSVQIYREFNIGSAKPSIEELKEVKHHLIDILDPKESLNAASFSKLAGDLIKDLRSKEVEPIIVGGTTLYLTALIHGLVDLPKANQTLRKKLEELESEELYEKLEKLDSKRAKELHPNDRVRVIRAIEILQSKESVSSSYEDHRFSEILNPSIILVLCRSREELYQRINTRVEQMIESGLVNEVKEVIKKYGREGLHALSSLGYNQVLEFIDGKIKEADLSETIAQQTRRYAKRQLTFWRNEPKKRAWLQEPSQDEGSEALLKSNYTPGRASQEIKDFHVLSCTFDDLVEKIKERQKLESSKVEVWYLDALKVCPK